MKMANTAKKNPHKCIEWHFQDLSVNILLKGNYKVCACIHTHTHNMYTHNGILFSHEKDGDPAICDNIGLL